MLRRTFLATALLGVSVQVGAVFPSAYAPTPLQPKGAPERYEFDLTEALQRAKRQHKRLYIYLGASDCPFCRHYEAFLETHAAALAPHFAKDYLVYDLRSSLRAQSGRLHFRIGNRSWNYTAFMTLLGDERARQLVYPSVWLLNGEGKPLMQMPAGTGTFETPAEQLEILQLVQ